MQLAGMASNRGRNLLHMADTAPGGATFSVIISNEEGAPVIESATERGIPTEVVERDPEETREEHEQRIVDRLESYDVDLICLDGYMRILTETFLDATPTTLNVHPSLLPSFPGMDTHRQVLDASVKAVGCTVHVVTDATYDEVAVVEREVDAGPIVTQEPLPVYTAYDDEYPQERFLY